MNIFLVVVVLKAETLECVVKGEFEEEMSVINEWV